MGKRKVGALEKVDADLPNLQHKIRRDPTSYKDDFRSQYSQYQAFLQLFLQAPASTDDQGIVSLRDLIDFISHVADCYPEVTNNFSNDLIELLKLHHAELETELREKAVGSLVLLRKKEIIDSSTLLTTLFPILVETPSKTLRALLFQKIVSDLRSSNAKTANHKLNRTMQIVLNNLISNDPASPKGVWAVKITRELWKRQIWTDARAVSVMENAALSQNEKVVTGGVHFFLGGDKEREEAADDSSDDEETIDMAKLRHQAGINKKTKKKANELKKAAATVKRKEKKKNAPHPLNFSALHLLHDPQGFAEKLFAQHLQTQTPKAKLNLEQKLSVLQLVSRLLSGIVSPVDTQLGSPDALEPLVQKIANEFVSEASAGEVASAGLNAIREICVRQPLAMNDTLLQDLVEYRKSKDKGTMMAAKGLLSLYREVGAELLKKRDRGKDATIAMKSGDRRERRFGEEEAGGIEGLELLEKFKEEERRKKRMEKGLDPDGPDEEGEAEEEEDEGWKNWDAESDDSDDSGGWINVESDGEDIVVSDSEDEKPPAAKKQKTTDAAAETKPDGAQADGEKSDAQKALEANAAAITNLATTRILTPADLAKLAELRTSASINALLPSRRGKAAAAVAARHADDPLTAAEIEGLASLSHRTTKEEKIAMAKADRDEKHLSRAAKKKADKQAEGKSTTNKEKARKKNF
ncbi:Severe Depolymerization of Actin [Taxawa tesnikishii (nom. ined.)]|nr:Severe Depolymerization of Actin [Dothideales sp. JES 119]